MNENFGIILVLILAFLNTVQHDIFTVISFYLIKFSFLLCYARGRELYQKKKKKRNINQRYLVLTQRKDLTETILKKNRKIECLEVSITTKSINESENVNSFLAFQ